jgi:hypothetical protein
MLEISLHSNSLKLLNVVSVEAVECNIRKEMKGGQGLEIRGSIISGIMLWAPTPSTASTLEMLG